MIWNWLLIKSANCYRRSDIIISLPLKKIKTECPHNFIGSLRSLVLKNTLPLMLCSKFYLKSNFLGKKSWKIKHLDHVPEALLALLDYHVFILLRDGTLPMKILNWRRLINIGIFTNLAQHNVIAPKLDGKIGQIICLGKGTFNTLNPKKHLHLSLLSYNPKN